MLVLSGRHSLQEFWSSMHHTSHPYPPRVRKWYIRQVPGMSTGLPGQPSWQGQNDRVLSMCSQLAAHTILDVRTA